VKIQSSNCLQETNILLIRVLENRSFLIIALIVSVLIAFKIQTFVIFPIESLLGFSITQHASMVYLPAGVVFLSFYLLRWWFFPVVLVGRTLISVQFEGWGIWLEAIIFNCIIVCLYPMWLHLLNSAKWDVFGDHNEDELTIVGAMIFALLVSFSTGLLSAIHQTTIGMVPVAQSLQYTVHFIIGDTLGTGVVLYLFYRLLKWNQSKTGEC
jgi:hypothetical protein